MDDEFQRHLVGRAIVRLLQGLSAAVLMPLDVLQFLRRGCWVPWRIWCSWLLPASMYFAGFEMWPPANRTGGSEPCAAGEILLCMLGLIGAAILTGELQARGLCESDREAETRAGHDGDRPHRHFHNRRHFHHDWVFPPGFQSAELETGGAVRPAPQTQASGTCCGDCRQCLETICAKTGLPKRKEPR